MKRHVVLLVVILLVLALLGVLPAPANAQTNCVVSFPKTSSGTTHYRVVAGSNVIGGPVSFTGAGIVVINIFANYQGSAALQASPNSNFSPFTSFTVNINCIGNNAEAPGSCDRIGGDVTVPQVSNSYTVGVTVFKNGNPFATQFFTVPIGSGFVTLELSQNIPIDHKDEYTYKAFCATAPQCAPGYLNGAVLAQGTLARKCDAPCGPAQDGAPLGRMLATVPLHTSPNAGSASDKFFAEAGKTFKILGTQGGFTRIALACQSFWVPSSAIAQCADPLCRN
ncbi:MAG: hypothetical protein NZ571_15550 [Anaerolineae bacterium]|nr:hypothetical protein [Anaerolineae bacterium]